MQDRPVLALYKHPTGGGKLVVLGSAAMLSDQYIDKEDNSRYRPPPLLSLYSTAQAPHWWREAGGPGLCCHAL